MVKGWGWSGVIKRGKIKKTGVGLRVDWAKVVVGWSIGMGLNFG